MSTVDLKYPITIDGNKISSVTIRRAIGEDLVTIGDEIATITSYYAAQAPIVAAAQAYIAAAKNGETPSDADIGQIKPPGAAEYRAMVAIAGRLTGLGDNAGKLDGSDLSAIAVKVLALGE